MAGVPAGFIHTASVPWPNQCPVLVVWSVVGVSLSSVMVVGVVVVVELSLFTGVVVLRL